MGFPSPRTSQPLFKIDRHSALVARASSRLAHAMKISSLRSPRATVGGIVYFGRMLDKIRLHADGKLPDDYLKNLGGGFDERISKFLHISYDDMKSKTLAGGSDEEVLEWAFSAGHHPSDEEIEVWNGFMSKRGWKDNASDLLIFRKKEANIEERADIETMFDYIDLDEA